MAASNPFCLYLIEQWRNNVFKDNIFPDFPFKPADWKALAFNRDNHGLIRLPEVVWRLFIDEVKNISNEKYAFIASPDPIISGEIMRREQPFAVSLNLGDVLAHFRSSEVYLPEFFMSGVEQKWAVWGDSDLTVVGGESKLLLSLIEELGGEKGAVASMISDFGLNDSADSLTMLDYFQRLVAGPAAKNKIS